MFLCQLAWRLTSHVQLPWKLLSSHRGNPSNQNSSCSPKSGFSFRSNGSLYILYSAYDPSFHQAKASGNRMFYDCILYFWDVRGCFWQCRKNPKEFRSKEGSRARRLLVLVQDENRRCKTKRVIRHTTHGGVRYIRPRYYIIIARLWNNPCEELETKTMRLLVLVQDENRL